MLTTKAKNYCMFAMLLPWHTVVVTQTLLCYCKLNKAREQPQQQCKERRKGRVEGANVELMHRL